MFSYCGNNPVRFSDATGLFRNFNVLEADNGGGGGGGALLFGAALLVSKAVEYASPKIEEIARKTQKTIHSNTVYVLKDKEDKIQYVGRTKNPAGRAHAHGLNPYRAELTMVVIASGLTLPQAKVVEQACMNYNHTINTLDKMNNQINGIAPRFWGDYTPIATGVLEYEWNQVSNEVLYWLGY